MIHLILFGPPGSGKGTQASRLEETFDLVHISTGDLFRSNIKEGTELGREAQAYMDTGELVPDELTVRMLTDRMTRHSDANGFIYDGFPRTVPQAEALDAMLAERDEQVSAMIALEVSEEELVKRLLARGRKDDNEEVIRRRFQEYQEKTAPVADHYDARGTFVRVPGEGDIEEIADRLAAEVKALA